jgi:hypothetical protein
MQQACKYAGYERRTLGLDRLSARCNVSASRLRAPCIVRCQTWPERAFEVENTSGALHEAQFQRVCCDTGPASEDSGPLFCAATVTDCDSNCSSEQVTTVSQRNFDDRALPCLGSGLSLSRLFPRPRQIRKHFGEQPSRSRRRSGRDDRQLGNLLEMIDYLN